LEPGTFRTGPAWPVVRDAICPSSESTPTIPATIDVFNVSSAPSYAGIAKLGLLGTPISSPSLLPPFTSPNPIITVGSIRAAERGMVDLISERSVFGVRFSMGLDPKRKIQPDTTYLTRLLRL
jgi:hypothetical protein